MTISSTTTSASYTGNGATTTFPIPFTFFGTGTGAGLRVIQVVIATDAETLLVNGTDYNVVGSDVVAAAAPAATLKWVIRRDTTQLQETDYVENDAFPAESHESALDRLTAITQEQQAELDRAAQLTEGFTGTFDPALPTPVANASFVYSADGQSFTTGPLASDISNAQTNATAAAASATAAAASETNAAASEAAAAASAAALASVDVDDLADVVVTAVSDGQILAYDNASTNWVNTDITGGGPSLGTDSILRTNANTIGENITIPSGTNASTVGPVTINTGFTVTVSGTWVVL